MEEATATVIASAKRKSSHTVRLSNAYCVALADTRSDYSAVLNGPGLTYADGAPVALLLRVLAPDHSGGGRVRGPSLFCNVLSEGRAHGLKHFLLGTTDETLGLLQDALYTRFPGLEIVGAYAPPFGALDSDDAIEDMRVRISATDADIIWVSLGTPKQDFVAKEVSQRTLTLSVGIGAAFDFAAGVVTEAPKWVQASGFEWLFRLCQDPSRLWRRYLFGNVQFIWIVFRTTLGRGMSVVRLRSRTQSVE
ncbi:WecB/TagA/CpsF family glycosyltransferase [Gordonia sp. N1V]|uniref:WecB/TagA/CpsF family glycosyltransferase n=1 Tax=Gordonia sp. N1V TaxID=3034163 RepID=UPI0023E1BFE9|nr:WecB/TagA/CpsF family glycosyltransferase [Gordonia sp. N1V]MDF3284674.1 WecB/TagA/CpsF family glycosyltransferase [Gordonia sp. N1V]